MSGRGFLKRECRRESGRRKRFRQRSRREGAWRQLQGGRRLEAQVPDSSDRIKPRDDLRRLLNPEGLLSRVASCGATVLNAPDFDPLGSAPSAEAPRNAGCGPKASVGVCMDSRSLEVAAVVPASRVTLSGADFRLDERASADHLLELGAVAVVGDAVLSVPVHGRQAEQEKEKGGSAEIRYEGGDSSEISGHGGGPLFLLSLRISAKKGQTVSS